MGPIRFNKIFNMRVALLTIAYGLLSCFSLYLSFELRYDFAVPHSVQELRLDVMWWIVPMRLSLLLLFGQFGGLLTYFRFPDLYRVFSALLLGSLFLLLLWLIMGGEGCPPRGVILADFVISLVFIGGFRIGLRIYRERFVNAKRGSRIFQRVAIVGAGDAGASLAAEFLAKPRLGIQPLAFLDDDVSKVGKHLHGIDVVGNPEQLPLVKKRYNIQKVIIAFPSAPKGRIKEVYELAIQNDLEVEMVPSLEDLVMGQVRVSQLRPVEFEDLLGREPAQLNSESIQQLLRGKVVLVTGAGGSIGSELCRQIILRNPKRLLLLDHSEENLFTIEQELIKQDYGMKVLPLVVNVLDEARLRYIFQELKPEIVFHAAAYKHVSMMESQPGEAVKNNVFGSEKVALLSSEYGVERFIFISTDKAINPTSVMGATKRLAEVCIQSIQNRKSNKTKFIAVRFGNVLGSSGSVIPIFKKQIAEGGPVTVTHPDVKRYFMTIPEAAGLVLQSSTQGQGGEIFVLDMGEPMKIIDVARQLIKLSGFEPEVDIEIQFIGLRPGEKLYEEFQHKGERFVATKHTKIFRFISKDHYAYTEVIHPYLDEFRRELPQLECNKIKQLLKKFIPEYTPFFAKNEAITHLCDVDSRISERLNSF